MIRYGLNICKTLACLCFLLVQYAPFAIAQQVVSLEGQWTFKLDSLDIGVKEKWFNTHFHDEIRLPGSTAQAGYGKKNTGSSYGILAPEYEYIGPAWYQRKIVIPESWKDKEVELLLERVLWESIVYLDGKEISIQDGLGTPHLHVLGQLTPGEHTLSIRINNDMIYNIGDKGHAYGEYMQSIWNGIVGKIELRANNLTRMGVVRTFPDVSANVIRVEASIMNLDAKQGSLIAELKDEDGRIVFSKSVEVNSHQVELLLDPKELLQTWSEYTPHLYNLVLTLNIENENEVKNIRFGFSEVSKNEHRILMNNQAVSLRGNLDCVHFPLTGYPATSVEEWRKIFRIYKSHGLNHVRFHSWCPPEAAFDAADELGIYIQAEASIWIDWWMGVNMVERSRPEMETKGHPQGLGQGDVDVDDFVQKEMDRMMDWYGNHPSFVLFCIGNELGSSNFEVMGEWIRKLKEKDPRRLYAASAARTVTPYCDYSATHNYPGIGG